jgi:CheY-like chemotaxis protein
MKILIVDDNAAIQEILTEILEEAGHDTDVASTAAEAREKIRSFKPEAVLLDSVVNGEPGMKALEDIPEDAGIRAILLTTGKEQVPKDNPVIAGAVQKPFRSADILSKIDAIAGGAAAQSQGDSLKGARRSRFSLFKKSLPEGTETGQDLGLKLGKSYIMFESRPNAVYRVAEFFRSKDCDVMIITTDKVKAVREAVKDPEMKIVGLSLKPRGDNLHVAKMGTLMGVINDFIESSPRPVVAIDDLEVLVEINGLNAVLTMIHQIINRDGKKQSSLLVSAKEGPLTDKDRELLMTSMELYKI